MQWVQYNNANILVQVRVGQHCAHNPWRRWGAGWWRRRWWYWEAAGRGPASCWTRWVRATSESRARTWGSCDRWSQPRQTWLQRSSVAQKQRAKIRASDPCEPQTRNESKTSANGQRIAHEEHDEADAEHCAPSADALRVVGLELPGDRVHLDARRERRIRGPRLLLH